MRLQWALCVSTSIFCWAATGTGCGFSTPGTLTRALVREPVGKTRGYVNELIARARQRGLAKTAQWRRLGHYVPSPPNGFESEAAGQNFFLAPNGKNDPQAELDATLRGFFSELAPYDAKDPKHKNVRHPLCQFPARFLWLSKALSIDSKRLKLRACAPYSEFKSSLQAKSVTLVFSSYYLNNPASAFGHTFLRINKANPHVPEERRQLLDYGLDFSAEVDTKNALFYAIKGIFGLFPGTFRKLPYYYKVREYNDYESRDLWEYELTLGEAQLNMLVAHAWELGATFFPYYYATANCSYAILALLEAADPSLSLLAHLHAPVIPADTVKSLYGNKGLVGRVKYRPSMRSVFQHRIRNLTDEQRKSLEHLVQTPDAPLPAALTTAQRIQMFDAAQDLVDIVTRASWWTSRRMGKAPRSNNASWNAAPKCSCPPPTPTCPFPRRRGRSGAMPRAGWPWGGAWTPAAVGFSPSVDGSRSTTWRTPRRGIPSWRSWSFCKPRRVSTSSRGRFS